MSAPRVVRRRKGARRAATEQAARIRWIVWARWAGERKAQGAYECPNEANAIARRIRRDERVPCWVESA